MQLRRWAALLVVGAALTTLGVPGTAQAASGSPRVASASIGGVWRATVDDNGFVTDFWWWPY